LTVFHVAAGWRFSPSRPSPRRAGRVSALVSITAIASPALDHGSGFAALEALVLLGADPVPEEVAPGVRQKKRPGAPGSRGDLDDVEGPALLCRHRSRDQRNGPDPEA